MNKISVVINTYNAESRLQQVLDSVKGFDEILVCDMESTDSTLEIARKNGCRIVTFPKGNHTCVEPARNFAIKNAMHQWVLIVDADEVVTSELRRYLYERITAPDSPQAIAIPRLNEFMGRFMHCTYPDRQTRFVERSKVFWPEYIHSVPRINGCVEKLPAKRVDLALQHFPDDTLYKRLFKTNAYTENEIVKRSGMHYGVGTLLWKPAWKFLRAYFLKGGFRDGVPGLIWAMFDAIYQAVLICKMIESQNGVASAGHE